MFFVCADNPRWLVHKGKFIKAAESLRSLGRCDKDLDELRDEAIKYEESKKGKRYNFFICLCSHCELGVPLFIGCFISMIHLATTGFYVGEIFRGDSYRNVTGFLISQPPMNINTPELVLGRILFMCTGIGLNWFLVDKIGRRPLMIGGLVSMTISFFVLAFGLHYSKYPVVIAGHFAHSLSNSIGPGPISTFMVAEMFEPVYRIAANSFCLVFASLVDFGIQMLARQIFDEGVSLPISFMYC